MRVSTRLVGALLTLALLHGSAAALVNDPAPRVAIRSCPSDLTREVGWLLEIELRTVDAGTQVAVSCADDAVKVVARDREEGRHVGRSLALGEVALSARARAVALAAAELVAALEGSPEPRPDSTEPTPADDEPQTVRRQASPAPASGRWELTASTTLGGLQRSFIYGGGLAVDHRPLRHLGWRAGLSAQSASSSRRSSTTASSWSRSTASSSNADA